ncbi:MAG: fluoride efflux transporter CrcB [Candidatus Sericytochromatia bacterium]
MLFSPDKILWVALGGASGSVLRYLLVSLLRQWHPLFPWGTLLVNGLGSMLAGVLLAYSAKFLPTTGPLYLLLMVGFLGGFTTFSAFSAETLQLWLSPHPALPFAALLNLALNLFGSLLAVTLAYHSTQYFLRSL